jgi:hypothetical protein
MRVPSEITLRANPEFDLIPAERIEGRERELCSASDRWYGILRPRQGSALAPRSCDPDTALLFVTLTQPAAVPSYMRGRLGDEETSRVIARLVLDDVLQVADGGRFVSGAAAGAVLHGGGSPGGTGRIAGLSLAALRYGEELMTAGVTGAALARRLYGYGRQPATSALAVRLAATQSRRNVTIADAQLLRGWIPVQEPSAGIYWHRWQRREVRAAALPDLRGEYKLYVSPAPEAIEPAFTAVAELLRGTHGAIAFKLAAGWRGLARPDKLVAYFDDLDDLLAAATSLREPLEGTPAHGVPFTAAITRDGLLSWAIDPPVQGGASTSWRAWVADRLAEYLVRARAGPLEPWQFALDRLQLAGVDTDTWVPSPAMWQRALVRG